MEVLVRFRTPPPMSRILVRHINRHARPARARMLIGRLVTGGGDVWRVHGPLARGGARMRVEPRRRGALGDCHSDHRAARGIGGVRLGADGACGAPSCHVPSPRARHLPNRAYVSIVIHYPRIPRLTIHDVGVVQPPLSRARGRAHTQLDGHERGRTSRASRPSAVEMTRTPPAILMVCHTFVSNRGASVARCRPSRK